MTGWRFLIDENLHPPIVTYLEKAELAEEAGVCDVTVRERYTELVDLGGESTGPAARADD